MAKSDQTYIVKAHKPLEELMSSNDPSQWEEFLDNPASFIAESITGFLSGGSPVALAGAMAGRVVQAALKAQIYRQLGEELKGLRDSGRIKEPGDTKFGFATWNELLSIIDSEVPDQERLDALKAMFLATNSVNASDMEHMVGYQLFQIAKKLSSGELLLLKAVFQAYRTGAVPDIPSAYGANWIQFDIWLGAIAKQLGGVPKSLVEFHEKTLIAFQLLSERHPTERFIVSKLQARLTDLGVTFCEQLQQYEAQKRN